LGRYAAFVEERHIFRWLVRRISDKARPIDILFVGNSHVMDGIDPSVVSGATGYNSYNLALYSLPSQNVMELLFKFDLFPKLVWVDFSTRYSTYKATETFAQPT
jgi:hypothetical protein